MVLGLATTFEDIKEYLPYEEEFWTYLKEEVKPKNTIIEEKEFIFQELVHPYKRKIPKERTLQGSDSLYRFD